MTSPRHAPFLLAPALAAALALAACETRVSGPSPPVQAMPPAPPPAATIVPPPPPAIAPAVEPPSPEAVILPPAPADPRMVTVALLVPLSGPNAAVGRALLDAAQLALFDVADTRFALAPRDTAGPEGADGAARAALAAGATLVLGPLLGEEIGAVAAVARAANAPVVSFSNNAAAAQPGVFVLGLLPRQQVERVVVHARLKGASRFAALLPGNAFGALAEEALRAALEGGGELVAVERYEPGAADLTPVVRRLAAAERRAAAAAGAPSPVAPGLPPNVASQLPPEVGFDAILIPDFGDRLLALAPLLPFHDLDANRFRYLGVSLWDDPRVGREPALVGGWYAGPAPESREQFALRFREAYGREPPRIAALGYDAAALAAVLAKDGGFAPDRLAQPDGFAGYDGLFRLRADGTNERKLAILQVQRGAPRVIDPAEARFVDATD
jgi:ABC-type branched-subunit amino acid transport system substrate-binding protein